MDQDKDISTYVSALIASPEKLSASDVPVLQEMLERYPYFQALHLLLARAATITVENVENVEHVERIEGVEPSHHADSANFLTNAVLYTNGELAYEFLHKKKWNRFSLKNAAATEKVQDSAIYELIDTKQLSDEQEVFDEIAEVDVYEFPSEEAVETETPIHERVNIADDAQENVNEEENVNEVEILDEVENIDEVESIEEVKTVEEDNIAEESSQPEAVFIEIETVENNVEEEEAPEIITVTPEIETAEVLAEEEDEDIHEAEELSEEEDIFEEDPAEEAEEIPSEEEVIEHTDPKSIPAIETQEDAFVLENIMSTDFFAFEQSFSSPVAAAPEIEEADEPVADHEYMPADNIVVDSRQRKEDPEVIAEEILTSDSNEVTNYHDEKMPYTFLWWLAKTRKEYQTIFQPYVSLKKNNQNELQQQYVEHIFHIQSPFNPEEILNNVPETKGDSKDLEIIDNFIKRDPQISPPRPEQIDTENKARKSAEDQNDVVSETLAKIYIEQMLYHKAIDTYDKLSLKFPEKSRYFADLIQSIKKKI